MSHPNLVTQTSTGGFRGHGFSSRNEAGQPIGHFSPTGKFGRLFQSLPIFAPNPEGLKELGMAMLDSDPDNSVGDNMNVPAGYTYLGQFIDHDITFDTTSLQEILIDPIAIRNFRTPMLDLDSLYGSGPNTQPYLYEYNPQKLGKAPLQDLFLIGLTNSLESGDADFIRSGGTTGVKFATTLLNDLPRASSGLGILGDPRNDENLIVAQLHLAFLKLHNKVVEGLKSGVIPHISINRSIFEQAREIVIWHYQWIVLHDFLVKLLDPVELTKALNKLEYYKVSPGQDAFIPVEYSVAAYRFGHSMVREKYDYNEVFRQEGIAPASLELLFQFTAKSGDDIRVPIPSNWIIDWNRFFEISNSTPVNHSRKLDPYLAPALHQLPNVPLPIELAVRNLIRGRSLGLPSGQNVAKAMSFVPLAPEEIANGTEADVVRKHGFDKESPLWYYILKEAEVQGKGLRMGQVGSRIIAEVIVGLLRADPTSFLVRDESWRPYLPAQNVGQFTMADLLRFVDDINPLDKEENRTSMTF